MAYDLDDLRQEFPDWQIIDASVAVNNGPDLLSLVAKRGDDERVFGTTVATLRSKLLGRDRFAR